MDSLHMTVYGDQIAAELRRAADCIENGHGGLFCGAPVTKFQTFLSDNEMLTVDLSVSELSTSGITDQ